VASKHTILFLSRHCYVAYNRIQLDNQQPQFNFAIPVDN